MDQRTQAASPEHDRVLGFETPVADWSTSNGSPRSASTTVSQGTASLSVTPSGYTEVVSIPVAAPGAARATATVDLRLPQTLGWGDVRLVVRVPSQGHWWRDLGGQPLAGRAPGVFHTFSFSVPEDLRSALNSSATDVDYRVILNVPGGSGSYLLDNLVVSDAVPSGGGTPAPTTQVEFSLAVPRGLAVADVMISGTNQVTIDDRSDLSKAGTLTHVTNLGSSTMEFGAQIDAYANVTSVGNVNFLRSQSHTYGSVTTAGTVTRQDGSVLIDGAVTEHASVVPVETRWTVDWPVGVTRDVTRAPDSEHALIVPGAWDSIQIFSRASVVLESGTYFINSLVVEPEAKLYIDATAGPVLIYVKDTLRLHVSLEYLGGERGQVLFGYLGNQSAYFEEAIVASVVAPNSVIDLRRPASGRPHEGSFFGKHVHVLSDATVLHLPLDWGFACPSGDSDGDGVLDCFDECWLDPDKTEPGLCGCGTPETNTDGDWLPNCLDECPLDAGVTSKSMCGCPSDPDVAPAGTPCNDSLLRGTFECDGQGLCGGTAVIDTARPEPDCVLRTVGNRAYWFCGGGGGGSGTGGGGGSGTGGGATGGSEEDGSGGGGALCKSTPGGHLVQIDDSQENAVVASQASGPSWIGAADFSVEGQWWWRGGNGAERRQFWTGGASGRRFGGRFTSWAGDAPVEDVAKNCGTIDRDGRWRAEDCSQVRPYICEAPFGSDRDLPSGIVFDEPKGPSAIISEWCDSSNPGDESCLNTTWTAPPNDDCLDPTEAGQILLDAYRSEGNAAANLCDLHCAEDADPRASEEECADYCDGPITPPAAGVDSCSATKPPLRELDFIKPGSCEVLDPAQLPGNENGGLSEEEILAQLRAAQDCSQVTPAEVGLFNLPGVNLRCGVKTLCLAEAAGSPIECDSNSDCGAGSCQCVTEGCDRKFCIDPNLANACQASIAPTGDLFTGPPANAVDASGKCTARCFSQVGCGTTAEEYQKSSDDYLRSIGILPPLPPEPPRCSEINLCGPTYDDELVAPELAGGEVFNDEDLPTEPDVIPEYPSDFEDPCSRTSFPTQCVGFCSSHYGRNDPACRRARHPWCTNDVVDPQAVSTSEGQGEVTGRRGAPGTPVGFSITPSSDLDFGLEPLPFGAAKFSTRAAAGVRATVDFDVLGTQGSVDIVNLKAEISATLCHASTAQSRLEVVGVDFLPRIASAAIFDSDEVLPQVDGKKYSEACEQAVLEYVDAFDRAKKALRDAQELITQYNALKNQQPPRTFGADFCETVAGRGMRPPGMEGACPESPEAVINRFIDYYHAQVNGHPQLGGGLSAAVATLQEAALSGTALREALNAIDGIPNVGADNDYTFFAELGKGATGSESVTLISLQFFIGPIPCLLEVTSYVDYGIKGGFGLWAVPGRLIGGDGEFVKVGAEVGPYANSGITLFVGVGFNIGVLSLAVGVEGGVTLGHVSLPASVSAGLALQRDRERREDRPLPAALAEVSNGTVLFPVGNRSQTFDSQTFDYQFKYKYGVGLQVTDILSGYLNGTLKLSFFFFSLKFSQRLATFTSGIEIPPVLLIGGEGGSELGGAVGGAPEYDGVVAKGESIWKSSFETVPFVQLNRLSAPATPLTANAVVDKERVKELFYDELCRECVPTGEACGRDADCCTEGNRCLSGPGGTRVCGVPACLPTGSACTSGDDCCGASDCLLGENGQRTCAVRVCDQQVGEVCSTLSDAGFCCADNLVCTVITGGVSSECRAKPTLPVVIR